MSSLVLVASSLFLPWADVSAIAVVDFAVRKFYLQAASALVGRDDDTFDFPAKRFCVLDDDWCARQHVFDGLGALVIVRLVVVLFALSFHLCIQDVDGLVG